MSNQRGFSLVEMLIAFLVAGILFLALGSMYVMTTRSFADSASQAALQRQGTLAMDEIARRVRNAAPTPPTVPDPVKDIGQDYTVTTCNGVAVTRSVSINTPDGAICYYGGSAGQLCEYLGTGTACRNLLSGGLSTVYLMTQTNPPDQRCPPGVAAGQPCLLLTAGAGGTSATVSFTIMDAPQSQLRTANVMSFSSTVSCTGRNC
jgi:prepilin-type N-terminal cleavage/methylation domain-containing protein